MSIPITITHRAVYIPHNGYARCRNTEITRAWTEIGSDKLAKAMRREFMRVARKHGITVHDASLLLMNGVGI